MKMKTLLSTSAIGGLLLMAGQVSADVSRYAANTNAQIVTPGAELVRDLLTASGNQNFRWCHFKAGPASIHFSAETATQSYNNGGYLRTRILIDPPGAGGNFWLSPTNDGGYAMDTATVGNDKWEGHAVHGGFNAVTGWYRIRVYMRTRGGNSTFRVDDSSLICMN